MEDQQFKQKDISIKLIKSTEKLCGKLGGSSKLIIHKLQTQGSSGVYLAFYGSSADILIIMNLMTNEIVFMYNIGFKVAKYPFSKIGSFQYIETKPIQYDFSATDFIQTIYCKSQSRNQIVIKLQNYRNLYHISINLDSKSYEFDQVKLNHGYNYFKYLCNSTDNMMLLRNEVIIYEIKDPFIQKSDSKILRCKAIFKTNDLIQVVPLVKFQSQVKAQNQIQQFNSLENDEDQGIKQGISKNEIEDDLDLINSDLKNRRAQQGFEEGQYRNLRKEDLLFVVTTHEIEMINSRYPENLIEIANGLDEMKSIRLKVILKSLKRYKLLVLFQNKNNRNDQIKVNRLMNFVIQISQ
eukprot:403351356